MLDLRSLTMDALHKAQRLAQAERMDPNDARAVEEIAEELRAPWESFETPGDFLDDLERILEAAAEEYA